MDWIKKNFEKVILAVLALGLLGSAVILFLDSREFREVFGKKAVHTPDNTMPALPTANIQKTIEGIRNPVAWTHHDGTESFFVSTPYILRGNELIGVLAPESPPIFPPVDNAYIKKYHLNYANPSLLNTDPDGDGFNVLEEWMVKSDPTDPKAIPPYYTKLRLKKYIRIPFLLKFNGTPDDGQTFTINAISLRGRTQFLKIGEMIEGTPFKLISYKEINVERDGIPYDESELIIENTETGAKVTLINEKTVDSPTSKALFLYLLDGSEFEVKKDDTFSLPQQPDVLFKLIDITDTQAVIQNVKTGDQHTVPSLQPQ